MSQIGPMGRFTVGQYAVEFDDMGYAVIITPPTPDVNTFRAISARVGLAYAMRGSDPMEWSKRVRAELSGPLTNDELNGA